MNFSNLFCTLRWCTAGSDLKADADHIAAKYPSVEPVLLNISERADNFEQLVQESDIVVSLLPYALHAQVAKSCIRNKVGFIYCKAKTSWHLWAGHKKWVYVNSLICTNIKCYWTYSIHLFLRLYAILLCITKKTARKWKFGIVNDASSPAHKCQLVLFLL